MADFAEVSKRVGFTAAALANVVRHIKITTELADIMEDHEDDVARALEVIRKRLAARAVDTEYVQERARTQLQVIFNLINQSEAVASREIATATKDDSAAMKVIAVMTLFFLPGTFFATLFSIPSLYWDDGEVGSPRFWVYWAFSAPCTLALVAVYGFYCWGSKLSASMFWMERASRKRE
ncbi:hypothetical protein OQA88_13406 [Cercophora sp. LCS_1]